VTPLFLVQFEEVVHADPQNPGELEGQDGGGDEIAV
jgi:hypothetical protein